MRIGRERDDFRIPGSETRATFAGGKRTGVEQLTIPVVHEARNAFGAEHITRRFDVTRPPTHQKIGRPWTQRDQGAMEDFLDAINAPADADLIGMWQNFWRFVFPVGTVVAVTAFVAATIEAIPGVLAALGGLAVEGGKALLLAFPQLALVLGAVGGTAALLWMALQVRKENTYALKARASRKPIFWDVIS